MKPPHENFLRMPLVLRSLRTLEEKLVLALLVVVD